MCQGLRCPSHLPSSAFGVDSTGLYILIWAFALVEIGAAGVEDVSAMESTAREVSWGTCSAGSVAGKEAGCWIGSLWGTWSLMGLVIDRLTKRFKKVM